MKRKLIINSGDKFGKLTIIKELEPTEWHDDKNWIEEVVKQIIEL